MLKVSANQWLKNHKEDAQHPDFIAGFAHANKIVADFFAENPELSKKSKKSYQYTLIFPLLNGTHVTNMLYHSTPKRTPMFIKGFNAASSTFSRAALKADKG